MFEPSQGVLEASRRVPQRPRAYRMPPGVSQSVLEHPESLQECLPGVSWTLEDHKKTLVSSIQCLLEGSGNFVVGLKLFQGVLECFGSIRKRPRASQKSSGMSRSALQRVPGTLCAAGATLCATKTVTTVHGCIKSWQNVSPRSVFTAVCLAWVFA